MNTNDTLSVVENMYKFILNDKLLITFFIFLLVLFLKYLSVKLISKKRNTPKENKKFKINLVNNLSTIVLIIIVFNIWSEEIQKFAISIAAFIVAFVLATREFIQCFIGFIYLLTSRVFNVGDWIQVGDNIGEVHSTDWAKLSLLEIDKDSYLYTGKTLFLPNSQLMISPIKNLNFLKRYTMHTFTIVRHDDINPFDFIETLHKKAIEYCKDFEEVAIRYNQLIENRLGINIAGPEPHIQVATSDVGDTEILFTIFCPTDKALAIEQKLTRDFMELWRQYKNKRIETDKK